MTGSSYSPGATGCIIDYEDSIEDDPDENGRWVNVNHDNDDLDSEADCLDYTDYNNSEENDFVKMRVVLDGPSIMRQSGTLRVTYSSWDTISDLPPYLYTVPLACLWKKEQTLQRDPYCIDRGGDYIDGKDNATGFGREYTVAQMGLHDRTQRHCWIEGIQPGAAVDKIRFLFEVDPDGPGPKPYAYPGDAVQARIVYPKVVVLDAGHGGSAPGNQVKISGTPYPVYEKELNYEIVQAVATILASGPTPLPTVEFAREGDSNTSFKSRVEKALRLNADLFVSVHHDSQNPTPGTNNYTKGYMRRYWGHVGVHNYTVNFLPSYLEQVPTCIPGTSCVREELVTNVQNALDTGNQLDEPYAGFAVLRWNVRRAVLLEVEALDQPGAAAYLTPTSRDERVEESAHAVADAIQTCLSFLAPMPAETPPPTPWYFNPPNPTGNQPTPAGNSGCPDCQ